MRRYVDESSRRHNERPPDAVDQMVAIGAGVTSVHVAAKAVKSVLPSWAQVQPSHRQKRQLVVFADDSLQMQKLNQPANAKLEQRMDAYISSLRSYVCSHVAGTDKRSS